MEILFATCADSASTDSTSNRLSLFNIVEEINAASFPGIIPSMSFVFLLARKKSEPDIINVTLLAELNGKSIFELPYKVSFQGKLRARTIANLQGVPVFGPGKLAFLVKRKGATLCEWPITVVDAGTAQISPPPPPVRTSGTMLVSTGAHRKAKKAAKRKGGR